MGKPKSRAQQFADLADPLPQDFDPEEDAPIVGSDEGSDSEESGDDLAGTEHYGDIGKSKLRKADQVALGPEYSGSRVSRAALNDDYDEDMEDSEDVSDSEDGGESENSKYADPDELEFDVDDDDGEIDSDAALGESDDEKFEKFTFRGSSKPKVAKGKKRPTASDFMSDSEDEEVLEGEGSGSEETDEDVLDVEAQHAEEDENDDDEEDEEEDSMDDVEGDMEKMDMDSELGEDEDASEDDDDANNETTRRAELRKIMNDEQKTVVATISQAAKADAEKGDAVRLQRKAFDSLLSVRMVIQKSLIATNSMAAVEKDTEESVNQPYEAAEEAAIKLWNTLEGMRHELAKKTLGKTGLKRKRDIDTTTSSSKIWERMENTESLMVENRQATLEKWSSKVRGSTSLPLSRKLNPTTQQSITSILQEQLANPEHLIKKTKMPRSCAPVQRDQKVIEDPNIYDDGNFYQMLLKELVDQRRVESLTGAAEGGKAMQWVAVKEAKTRKNVDTKASKGRKMRFTVHEKLQNFMAPDNRGSWEPEQIDNFFVGLLGQKMNLVEEEEVSDDEKLPMEDEALMMFGGS